MTKVVVMGHEQLETRFLHEKKKEIKQLAHDSEHIYTTQQTLKLSN